MCRHVEGRYMKIRSIWQYLIEGTWIGITWILDHLEWVGKVGQCQKVTWYVSFAMEASNCPRRRRVAPASPAVGEVRSWKSRAKSTACRPCSPRGPRRHSRCRSAQARTRSWCIGLSLTLKPITDNIKIQENSRGFHLDLLSFLFCFVSAPRILLPHQNLGFMYANISSFIKM